MQRWVVLHAVVACKSQPVIGKTTSMGQKQTSCSYLQLDESLASQAMP